MKSPATDAPPFVVPENTRETIISRKEMYRLNFGLTLPYFWLSVAITFGWFILAIILVLGGKLPAADPFRVGLLILSVPAFYALFYQKLVRQSVLTNNLLAIPTCYGWTDEILYVGSCRSQTVFRWEHFSKWRQNDHFFLLLSQGMWVVLPKRLWTEAQLEELLEIFHRQVGSIVPLPDEE